MKINQLVPELAVTDINKSLAFYVDILGFNISYQRPAEGFAFLVLDDAQLMLDEIDSGRTWRTGELNFPLGRGIHFQITVNNINSLLARLKQHNIELFLELEEKWYQQNNNKIGYQQFLVMDPDGYLLRFVVDVSYQV
mgnify:CR=1 FL=1